MDGDRLYGRGAYDMKGGLASMMCALHDVAAQERVRVHFLCVCDEESEEEDEDRGSDVPRAKGYLGDFAITGEPTDLHIGVQAKGVLVLRIEVAGTSAHGSTPWIGDNAVVRAIDVFRQIESLPFARESSDLFDRPSINLGRIAGGDAINRVPDSCVIDVDIRYLPGQDADDDPRSDQRARRRHRQPHLPPPSGDGRPRQRLRPGARRRRSPRSWARATSRSRSGRHGASDATAFLDVGVPAVECGPAGAGHHGPDEWVSIRSLSQYRRALVEFVQLLPARLDAPGDDERRLRIA